MDSLEGVTWLYRGVPRESSEVEDVRAIGEIRPPRPDRVGEYWRWVHVHGNTETGYTSWTTERDIAVEAAVFTSSAPGLSGEVVIFRVPTASLSPDHLFAGLEDEAEIPIEGTIEGVSISEGEEENDHE